MTSLKTLKKIAILSVLAAIMSISSHTFSKADAPALAQLKLTEPSADLSFYTFNVFPAMTQQFSLAKHQTASL